MICSANLTHNMHNVILAIQIKGLFAMDAESMRAYNMLHSNKFFYMDNMRSTFNIKLLNGETVEIFVSI